MLTAFLFDHRRGKSVESWADLLDKLGEDQLLWVDLLDPNADEQAAVREGFDLEGAGSGFGDNGSRLPTLELAEKYLRVTAIAVSDKEKDPAREAIVVDCFVGANWALTVRSDEIAVVDDFRAHAEGGGELGALDGPSFLATLLEWVVTSYLRAFSEIEETLEEFDVSVLRAPGSDTERQIAVLVAARSRIGRLRRALAPHREIFATLSHPELDSISTELSGERFEKLAVQIDGALASARDARDAVVSSFDVLILRTEHRTNEIVKVLTLASILLLPGALIAGVMGMNVNFSGHTFAHSPLFWIVVVAILVIALTSLVLAHWRRWI